MMETKCALHVRLSEKLISFIGVFLVVFFFFFLGGGGYMYVIFSMREVLLAVSHMTFLSV